MKLHLGCGKRNLGKDWIHIDLANYLHIDYNQSIISLPQFKDNSVDEIYSSHSLEYFDRQEAEICLKEWYRVLKQGGLLRLAVPDFEGIVKVYRKYKDLEHRGILGPLFGKMEGWFPVTMFNISNYIYHKTVYDFDSLKKLLESVGFKGVKRYDVVQYFKTLPRDYDDQSFAFIPERDPEGICVSLNIICKKGGEK